MISSVFFFDLVVEKPPNISTVVSRAGQRSRGWG